MIQSAANSDRARRMGEGSIPRLLLSFSVPAIVGMMVNALYNVVDRIFIGRGVGPLGIAGATVGFPIMLVLMAFGMLVGMGGAALISIRLGEGKKEEAARILGNSFILLILVSAVLTILGLIFLEPLLRSFGASETILPYARQYVSIILAGSMFMGIGFGMNNFIRAEGNPRIAMATMLIGAVLNIILDPIFIFALNMGIRGAALATILSQAVAAAWVLSYFLGKRSSLPLRGANLRLDPRILRAIVAIGSPPFVMQLAASVLNAILNNQLQRYGGDLAISAMGIMYGIVMFMFMPIFGLNQGAQPIIGFNYGARKYDRVKKTLVLAIVTATAIVMVGFFVTRFFPGALIRLFSGDNPELVDLGSRAMRMFLLMMPVIGFQIVSANYFQAVGKPRPAMILSLSRQVLILIPALLILPRFFGLDGVFIAGPVADLTSAILTGTWLLFELRSLGREAGADLRDAERAHAAKADARGSGAAAAEARGTGAVGAAQPAVAPVVAESEFSG
jgi:putative MATE family efflux protein